MADKVKVVRKSLLRKKQVDLAVSALTTHIKQKQGGKPSLLGEEQQALWLIMALKKIPAPDSKPKRIPLSKALHPEDTEVCLLTKTDNKVLKELIKSTGIASVKKVISFTKLKKNYKSYESKRQLASLYDVFICDEAIFHMLPKCLGKAFYAKKRFPLPISLKKKDINGEINKVLNSTFMSLGHGPCSAIRVGHTGLTDEELTSNVIEAVKNIAKIVPRGWKNIKSLNIKTSNSISLPIYNSVPDRAVPLVPEAPIIKSKKPEKAPKPKSKKLENGSTQKKQKTQIK